MHQQAKSESKSSMHPSAIEFRNRRPRSSCFVNSQNDIQVGGMPQSLCCAEVKSNRLKHLKDTGRKVIGVCSGHNDYQTKASYLRYRSRCNAYRDKQTDSRMHARMDAQTEVSQIIIPTSLSENGEIKERKEILFYVSSMICLEKASSLWKLSHVTLTCATVAFFN